MNAPDITTTQGCATAPSSPCCSAVRCAGPQWRRSPTGAVRAHSRRRRRSRTAREYAGACFSRVPLWREAIAQILARKAGDRAFTPLKAYSLAPAASGRPVYLTAAIYLTAATETFEGCAIHHG